MRVPITLVYVGRRTGKSDRPYYAFRQSDGALCLFAKVRFCVIGSVYAAEQEDDRIFMDRRPLPVDDDTLAPSKEEIQKWEVEDLMARDLANAKAAAKRAERNPSFLADAHRVLGPLVRGLKPKQRRALLEYLFETLKEPF